MARLNRYNDFYLRQMAAKRAQKISFINDIKIREFESISGEGDPILASAWISSKTK